MLAIRKLNNLKILVSLALINLEISHEEYKSIISEKEMYEQMKGIRNIKSNDELSENSKNIRENSENI